MLLIQFKNIFFNEKTALHIAIEKDDMPIVRELLAIKEIDINIKAIQDPIFLYRFKFLNFIKF